MVVLDASIVVKLITREAGASIAVNRVAREIERTAPDWMHVEVANALSKKIRYGGMPMALAHEGLQAVQAILPDVAPSMPLIEEAMKISADLQHALYDCLYLALALREQCPLLTADRKFHGALTGTAYASHVELVA